MRSGIKEVRSLETLLVYQLGGLDDISAGSLQLVNANSRECLVDNCRPCRDPGRSADLRERSERPIHARDKVFYWVAILSRCSWSQFRKIWANFLLIFHELHIFLSFLNSMDSSHVRVHRKHLQREGKGNLDVNWVNLWFITFKWSNPICSC